MLKRRKTMKLRITNNKEKLKQNLLVFMSH